MATQNQGNANTVTRSVAYDNPSYLTRQSSQLTVNTAGSASISGSKFYAHAAVIVWGVTFATIAAGTSTYTVNGTSTTPATQVSALYVFNSATSSVSLGTTTVGPFTLGGTSTTGTNVNVGGIGGGAAGGWQGPYAFNTLGGTNTSQTWGTLTLVVGTATGSQFSNGPFGGGSIGQGGLPMNPGEVLYFVNGTDATATWIATIQYSLQPPGYNNLTGAQIVA